ncbi:MAG: hypothetical protein JWP66_1528 [Naasia sp.]|nr:hypothetical protein [Naasia sp.]
MLAAGALAADPPSGAIEVPRAEYAAQQSGGAGQSTEMGFTMSA